jgi:C4-dicarboxylate transporter DctM subunit
VPGGLALAAILSGAAFASISGSGTVTLLAVGSIMYPALLAAGYPKPFALGALCASGTLGIVIPPSIPLILYGVMTQTSITDLFVAGIGPGLLLTLLFSAYAMLTFRSRAREPWSGAALIRSARAGIWAMLMPVVVLGGIYSGYFTATESAAVAVVYALLVETCVYRELRMAALRLVMIDTARMLGALFPVLMLAVSLNVFLTYEQVPELLVAGISDRISSTTGFLLLTNLLLLAVGCVVDIGSAVLLLAPLLEPLAAARGVDPVHFGILMLVNLEIGYLTPPMGLNLIVAMLAFREDFATVCRAVVPFILLMLLALLAVSFWPPLSLFLLD